MYIHKFGHFLLACENRLSCARLLLRTGLAVGKKQYVVEGNLDLCVHRWNVRCFSSLWFLGYCKTY